MPLGTKVALHPCHIVLDGDPTPPPLSKTGGGQSSPHFLPMAVYMPCLRPVPVFTDTGRNGVNGPRCRGPVDGLYMTEAEAKAEAKVIITRPRPAIFVYNLGSTDLLGQRDLLRSFKTANYLIVVKRSPISATVLSCCILGVRRVHCLL